MHAFGRPFSEWHRAQTIVRSSELLTANPTYMAKRAIYQPAVMYTSQLSLQFSLSFTGTSFRISPEQPERHKRHGMPQQCHSVTGFA